MDEWTATRWDFCVSSGKLHCIGLDVDMYKEKRTKTVKPRQLTTAVHSIFLPWSMWAMILKFRIRLASYSSPPVVDDRDVFVAARPLAVVPTNAGGWKAFADDSKDDPKRATKQPTSSLILHYSLLIGYSISLQYRIWPTKQSCCLLQDWSKAVAFCTEAEQTENRERWQRGLLASSFF